MTFSDYFKTLPQYILPKQGLTTFAGVLANVKKPWLKNHLIKDFIRKYHVNMSEALEENPENYACFNDFFIRHLKPECRPIAQAGIVSPVDGYVSEIGDISSGQLLQAKGLYYSIQELLACDAEKAKAFEHGKFATLYLSPKDYHRVHLPMDATLQEMIYVPGTLFSVQPTTARVIPRLFARNERLVVLFNTKAGAMAMILVGATIVGGIGTSWHGDVVRSRKRTEFTYPSSADTNYCLSQGEEMGYFKLGSTVILLFADEQSIRWEKTLKAGDRVLFGKALGETKSG